MNRILVTCYVNPDLDGTACAIAYSEFLNKTGKEVFVGVLGKPHDEACYILNHFGFDYPKILENANDFDEVILVDASDLNGLEGKVPALKVVEIIDHRRVNEADKFPNAKSQIEFVGAAATLIAEKFIQNNVDISQRSATLLYGAIISNTLNFKASITTDRDKLAAGWLNKVAKLPDDFWKDLFLAKSDLSDTKLAERIKSDFAWFTFGNKTVGIAQIEMIGAEKLISERCGEIVDELKRLQSEMNLDFIFQSIVELEQDKNYFITHDPETQKLLESFLGCQFVGKVAKRPNMILRKQIVPMLKVAVESK